MHEVHDMNDSKWSRYRRFNKHSYDQWENEQHDGSCKARHLVKLAQ